MQLEIVKRGGDELGSFLKCELLEFEETVANKDSNNFVAFEIGEEPIGIQSCVFSLIPQFLMKIKWNLDKKSTWIWILVFAVWLVLLKSVTVN